MDLKQTQQNLKSRYQGLGWKRYLIAGLLLLALIYVLWLRFFQPKPLPTGAITTAPPAKQLDGMPQKEITPKQVIVYRDKIKVIERLKLSPAEAGNPDEEIQTAVDLPKLKYGGTATVFLNTSTGKNRTLVKAKTSPLFAFRADNSLGVGYGIGTQGQTAAIRYRRDVAQIKEVYLSGEIEANYAGARKDPVEGKAMIWGEYRW